MSLVTQDYSCKNTLLLHLFDSGTNFVINRGEKVRKKNRCIHKPIYSYLNHIQSIHKLIDRMNWVIVMINVFL